MGLCLVRVNICLNNRKGVWRSVHHMSESVEECSILRWTMEDYDMWKKIPPCRLHVGGLLSYAWSKIIVYSPRCLWCKRLAKWDDSKICKRLCHPGGNGIYLDECNGWIVRSKGWMEAYKRRPSPPSQYKLSFDLNCVAKLCLSFIVSLDVRVGSLDVSIFPLCDVFIVE